MLIFSGHKRYKENRSVENCYKKNSCPFTTHVKLFNTEPFLVSELPPLLFKRFSTTTHYPVMSQMILMFTNIFQTLNINLLIYMKFKLKKFISYFKKFKNSKCNYDVIGDLMNINEAGQTYPLISKTNEDNLMRFSLFIFSQQNTFFFIMKTTFIYDRKRYLQFFYQSKGKKL